MITREMNPLVAAAIARESRPAGLPNKSSRRERLSQEAEPVAWPGWYKEEGKFIQESGVLGRLRGARNLLLTEYDDARLVLSRENPQGTPRLLVIWNNQERSMLLAGEHPYRYDSFAVEVTRNEDTKINGIAVGGASMDIRRLASSPTNEITEIPTGDISPEGLEEAFVKAASISEFFKGYNPGSLGIGAKFRRHQIDRATIK